MSSIIVQIGEGTTIDLDAELQIENTEESITNALLNQAATYAWWAVKLAMARKEVSDLEAKIKFVEGVKKRLLGKLDIKLRSDDRYKQKYGISAIKSTEGVYEAALESSKVKKRYDKILFELHNKLNEAKFNESLVWGVIDALKQRNEDLLALSFNLRKEKELSNIYAPKEPRREEVSYE